MSAARHDRPMQDVAIGRVLRELRRRRGWRQADLAARAGLSQSLVSTVERGHVAATTVDVIRRLFAAVDGRVELVPSWRGADLERLLDQDHARLVASVARRIEAAGWIAVLEVTYNEFGDRGSIDVLGLHPGWTACVVVEVKTAMPSVEALGRKLDEKGRIAPGIVKERWGWRPQHVARVVVVPDTMRLRRTFEREATLRKLFPARHAALRAWLAHPSGALAAAWFRSDSTRSGTRYRQRVRVQAPERPPSVRAGSAQLGSAAASGPMPSKTAGAARR